MLWSEHKPNSVALIGEELSSRFHGSEYTATFLFVSQCVLWNSEESRNQTHNRLTMVRIEVVHHGNPICIGVGANRLFDVLGEIVGVACWANGSLNHLPFHYIPAACQAQRSMAIVLAFQLGNFGRFRASFRSSEFIRLKAGHFVDTNGTRVVMFAGRRSFEVSPADFLGLSLEEFMILFRRKAPVLAPMWLKIHEPQQSTHA